MGNGENWFLGKVGSLVSVIGVIVVGVVTINAQMYQFRRESEQKFTQMKLDMVASHYAMERRIAVNEQRLLHLPARDRWRGADQIEWAHDLEKANRESKLVVPDPRVIIQRKLLDAGQAR